MLKCTQVSRYQIDLHCDLPLEQFQEAKCLLTALISAAEPDWSCYAGESQGADMKTDVANYTNFKIHSRVLMNLIILIK